MKIVHTRDTMSDIYVDAMRIRHDVFIIEQGVPSTIEIDSNEALCIHFVLYLENEAVATCRLLPLESGKIKLQRMAVEKSFRGKSYGRHLIEAAEHFAKQQNFNVICLGAQVTALGFYEDLGYTKEGEPFVEAGIQHFHMEKNL